MRKIIYSRTKKHSILKIGIYCVVISCIFFTLLVFLLTFRNGSNFDFSIYIIPFIILIAFLFVNFMYLKFNRPFEEFYFKQHEELIKKGNKCDGEIIEIEKHRSFSDNYRFEHIYYTLKVKYFSTVYNKYIIASTDRIENISGYDILGYSKKCIVYEKEDAIIIESATAGMDNFFKFWSVKNLINGVNITTTKGYTFIVTEADIIEDEKVKKKSWLASILFVIIFFTICALCIYYS